MCCLTMCALLGVCLFSKEVPGGLSFSVPLSAAGQTVLHVLHGCVMVSGALPEGTVDGDLVVHAVESVVDSVSPTKTLQIKEGATLGTGKLAAPALGGQTFEQSSKTPTSLSGHDLEAHVHSAKVLKPTAESSPGNVVAPSTAALSPLLLVSPLAKVKVKKLDAAGVQVSRTLKLRFLFLLGPILMPLIIMKTLLPSAVYSRSETRVKEGDSFVPQEVPLMELGWVAFSVVTS
ncbi:unnamed protein product [Linum trigynum]|uniref:Uncharacterized protein n=1 Tax=Linum trigynum TaxID=586398 RepID=A0AAV2E565_9ROSI